MIRIPLEADIPFIAIIVVAAILFLIIVFYFSPKAVILRELKKSKAIPIMRVQEGSYAKVIGVAKLVKAPLIAPISGRECVFYQIIVEKRGAKNSWRTVIDQTVIQDFFIETQGEMAVVKAEQPKSFRKIFLEKDHKANSGFWNEANHRLEKYLKSHGSSSKGLLGFSKTMRYFEGIIEPDERIAVKGIGHWKNIKEPIAGYNYSKVLTLEGSKVKKLLITDLKKVTQQGM